MREKKGVAPLPVPITTGRCGSPGQALQEDIVLVVACLYLP